MLLAILSDAVKLKLIVESVRTLLLDGAFNTKEGAIKSGSIVTLTTPVISFLEGYFDKFA